MRTILLSMQPFWTEQIMSGNKIYEYRNKFANEELLAYLYVSKPIQEISGIIRLGKRELLSDWKEIYKDDKIVVGRIEDYEKRKNKYAMPVLSYQRTSGIKLCEIQSEFPEFLIPQSYYYLDNLPLLEYIENHIYLEGEQKNHEFEFIDKNEICRSYR